MRLRRRSTRVRLAIIGLALLGALSTEPAAATDGPPIGSLFRCDRPVTPPRCTSVADSPRHHVALDLSLPEGLARALRDTMAEDYGPTDLVMIVQDQVNGLTDVIATAGDFGENGAAGWVWCPADAPQGVNPSGDRWCRHQELKFNLNPRYAIYIADDGSRAYVACHELGHTVGLRHWGNPPESDGPPASTCMNADTPDGPTDLSPDDVERINAYAYVRRPSPRHRLVADRPERRRPSPFATSGTLQALEVEHVPTLDSLVSTSDLVVRGRAAAVVAGRTFGGLRYASVTVEIEEILAGAAASPGARRVLLEVPLFDGGAGLSRLARALPFDGIFFLRNKGASAATAGASSVRRAAEARFYRLMTFDALVVDRAGRAEAVGEHRYLEALDGRAFGEVVRAVRRAAR